METQKQRGATWKTIKSKCGEVIRIEHMNCSIRITSPHLLLIVFHVAPCCFCVSIIIKLNILLPNKDLD
jgi:hypothetical protein